MKKTCKNCGTPITKEYCEDNYPDVCEHWTPKKPQTNADRIRAMSDEELAEFIILSPEMEFDVCLLCQFGNPTPRDDRGQCLSGYGACDAESRAEAFKKWLKQPAEE